MGEAARMLVEEEKAHAWLRRVKLEPEDEKRMNRAVRDQKPAKGVRRGVTKAPKKPRKHG
jgi:GH25 family lysozyme M1 (1,4-beta-N-acetylmuramidase)